jgi:thiol-disulfide isomerase/thioredoxin
MKLNFIYYLLIFFCLVSCNKNIPNTFLLKGEIVGLADSTTLVLSYLTLDNDKWMEVKDTAYIKDGKFMFKGSMNELTAAFLDYENTFVSIYLEPVIMELKLNKNRPWEYELSGTKAELENIVLREKLKLKEEELYKESLIAHDIVEQINLNTEITSVRDSLINLMKISSAKLTVIKKQMDRIRLNYILENKTSKIAPYLVYTMVKRESVGLDTLKNAYDNLSKDTKMTMLGRLALIQIEHTKKLINGKHIIEGSIAPDFIRTDILMNNIIKLSDFQNKNYVLLDFWASWCGPCIKEIPTLKEVYRKYKKEQLVIISISADENRNDWHKAIKKYKLEDWPQISGLAYSDGRLFNDDISDIYGIEYIPTFILIDKQGKVVARWQHIEDKELAFINKIMEE